MQTAQDAVQHIVGILVLLWVLGYTGLRVQEAWVNHHAESGDESDSASEGGDEDPAKGTFAYAQKRRREGKWGDAPFWGLLAGANGIRKVIVERFCRDDDGEDAPEGDRPDPDGEDDKPKGRRWQDRRERTEEDRRWRPYDEDVPDEERRRRDRDEYDEPHGWWGRRFGGRRRRPEQQDITVEEVPRYGPRDPELDRPIRALDPPGAPEQPEPVEVLPARDIEIDVVRTTTAAPREGIEPAMAGGHVAIPGTGNAVAQGAQGGVAQVTGNGDSHDDAKDLARKIVRAMEMTQDPVAQAEAMIRVSLQHAWGHVERLQAAGIGGSVLEGWCQAVVAYGLVHQTAKVMVTQLAEARDAAAQASRRQAVHGDRVQDAVEANPKSTANHTSYYGKR